MLINFLNYPVARTSARVRVPNPNSSANYQPVPILYHSQVTLSRCPYLLRLTCLMRSILTVMSKNLALIRCQTNSGLKLISIGPVIWSGYGG